MKLSNFNFLNDIQSIKQRIGAKNVEINYGTLDQLKPNDMGDIKLVSGEDWQEHVTHDPTTGAMLDKSGNIMVVYIDDNTEYDLNTPVEELKKVHITWCEKLEEMKRKGRYDRYVATRNQDDSYLVQLTEDLLDASNSIVKENRSLRPCQNCLDQTNIGGFDYKAMKFPKRQEFVKNFKMKTWFKYCNKNSVGNRFEGTRTTIKKADYTDDWPIISRKYRESKNWTCEKCGLDLSDDKRNLTTHHKNGVKSDNKSSNLKALCRPCHKEEDYPRYWEE